MPSEGLPLMVVTSGLGVGVLAGVVSGICYVFVQGFRTGRRRSKYGVTNPWQCSICGVHFRSAAVGVREIDGCEEQQGAVCALCDGHTCQTTCGRWVCGQWLCQQCERHATAATSLPEATTPTTPVPGRHPTPTIRNSWFRSILTALQPNTVVVRMSKSKPLEGGTAGDSTREGKNSQEGQNEDKEVVRDFIERLVGAMLGADLDDTSVNRLYLDPEYEAMFDRYHGDVSVALTDLGSALHISIASECYFA